MKLLIAVVALLLGIAIPKPASAAPTLRGNLIHTPAGTSIMLAYTSSDTLAAWCIVGRQSFPLDPTSEVAWSSEYWVLNEPTGAPLGFVAVDRDGTFTVINVGTY